MAALLGVGEKQQTQVGVLQEECYRGSVTGVVLQEWRCRGSVAGGVTGGVLQEKRTGRVLQEEC